MFGLENTREALEGVFEKRGPGKVIPFENRCTHFGRRLDPLPGQPLLECCSIGKSTFNFSGSIISGSGKGPIKYYPVEKRGGMLLVSLYPYSTG